MNVLGIVTLALILLAEAINGQTVPPNDTILQSALRKAFPGYSARIPEERHGKPTTVVLERGQGNKSENAEVSQVLSVKLVDGINILAFAVNMTDRLIAKREAIDRQQYGNHETTAFLLLAIQTRDEPLDVRKTCAAVSNEVSGSYAGCESLAILGPNRKQLGVTYISYFQDEDLIGMRKTKIIYDLPSAREIFSAVVGVASSAASGLKREWSLSYHKSPNSAAMQIHRVREGSDEIEVYEFDGTAFVMSGTEHTSPNISASYKDLAESYRRGMEWRGTPARTKDASSTQQILMTKAVIFDELRNEELMKIVKAAYPESRRISLIGKKMKPSRWGDQTNWTGEVEFKLENADSSSKECFLVWPARSVLTNGVVLLSGLVLPNQRGAKQYKETSSKRMARKETAEAVFACVKIDSRGSETDYRDVVAHGVYGVDETLGSRSGFRIEPGEGLFRELAVRVMSAGKSPTDTDTVPIEEDWIHIYELTDQRLVLRVAYRVMCGSTNVFTVGGNPQWKDIDGDGVVEVILKDAEDSAYIYKWEQGTYAYWMHGKIEPDAEPHGPNGLNPSVKLEILVKDAGGTPLAGCEITVEITSKHQNVLDLYKEPMVKHTPLVLTTDSKGSALLNTKAFIITLAVAKPGYAQEKMRLRPFAEPIPNVLNITLRKMQ